VNQNSLSTFWSKWELFYLKTLSVRKGALNWTIVFKKIFLKNIYFVVDILDWFSIYHQARRLIFRVQNALEIEDLWSIRFLKDGKFEDWPRANDLNNFPNNLYQGRSVDLKCLRCEGHTYSSWLFSKSLRLWRYLNCVKPH
jgi:hypothetical protein